MDPNLAPIDVAQHLPFVDRHLIRTPPAVRRAMWLVAVGQVENEGDPCPVRARALAGGDTPGEAGRTSVVLNELEERGVLVRYRGRGRRPHLWSFRPRLEYWQGFHWGEAPRDVSEAVSGCFCRATDNFVARFPGQSVVQLSRRARFELLPRDHIAPPGLLLVETRAEIMGRAPISRPPGRSLVETRENAGATTAVSLLPENSENSLLSEEESLRLDRLRSVVEYHARAHGQVVYPGSMPEARLIRIARALDDAAISAVCAHFDKTVRDAQIPSGTASLESMARRYLPKVATAL